MVQNLEFKILQLLKLKSHPDSVEWCPVNPYRHYFTCGTYELVPNDSTNRENENGTSETDVIKMGHLYLYEIRPEGELKLHNLIETKAIFDMKWCNCMIDGNILLATANVAGQVIIWKLFTEESSESACLKIVTCCELENYIGTSVLSIDWFTGYNHKLTSTFPQETICISDSKGIISILQFTCDCKLIVASCWKGHKFEAWIVACNYWDCNTIFSGGDDGALNVYDIRLNPNNNVVYKNTDHIAGVTSLRCNHVKEHNFVSGSYDETVKCWDLRNMESSVSTLKLNGGIWRLKWHPVNAEFLLIAAMFGGFHLINSKHLDSLSYCSWKLPDSLSYGADFSYLSSNCLSKLFPKIANSEFSTDNFMLASMCTYYDNTLILSLITSSEYEENSK